MMADSMAIYILKVLVIQCQQLLWLLVARWENGNKFTCDNTGGTEALVCDNMSSNNMDNRADSYRCSCPKIYEYTLVAANTECSGQTWVNGQSDHVTLQECIARAEPPGSGCSGNLIEW